MGRIIRICEFGLCTALLAWPASANAPSEALVSRYASARLAEIGQQDRVALDGYLKLYRQAPDSGILADRLFDTAIRAGDMANALRAARVRELKSGASSETALLLFADAWRSKNWGMADITADELSVSGNLGFMAPILKSWVRVSAGKNPDLPDADAEADGLFAYYSADQRIYLDLAAGRFTSAKLGLRAISRQSGDYVRDVMITGAETLAGNDGDAAFAEALMRSATGSTDGLTAAKGKMPSARGLSALYARVAGALIEQEMPREGLILARIASWISPSEPSVQITLAGALQANGLTDEALRALENTQTPSPYRAALLESRVDILIAAQDIASAQSLIADAVRATPKSVATKLLYARVQQAANNVPKVVSTYREITTSPDFGELPPRQQANYRLLLASALDQSNDWPSARTELEAALRVDPDNAQALNHLGYSLLERGLETEYAAKLVQRAHDLVPTSTAISDSLGWAFFLQGKAQDALPYLEKAAKDSGADSTINEHLGDVYWSLGRRRDARYAWNVASQSSDGVASARLREKVEIGLPVSVR